MLFSCLLKQICFSLEYFRIYATSLGENVLNYLSKLPFIHNKAFHFNKGVYTFKISPAGARVPCVAAEIRLSTQTHQYP